MTGRVSLPSRAPVQEPQADEVEEELPLAVPAQPERDGGEPRVQGAPKTERDALAMFFKGRAYFEGRKEDIELRGDPTDEFPEGELIFALPIRGLDEEAFERLDELAMEPVTDPKTNKPVLDDNGIQVQKRNTRYLMSLMIYEATIPEVEDRIGRKIKVWDVKTLWDEFNVAAGVELVDAFLGKYPGVKGRIADRVNVLSGIGTKLRTEAKI